MTPSGELQRVYTVCNVDVANTDNWLRLPYLRNSVAHRVYVQVRFSVRQCVNFPNPAILQQCKVIHCGTFTVYKRNFRESFKDNYNVSVFGVTDHKSKN